MTVVPFAYLTGIRGQLFRNARLTGSWNDEGRYSDTWSVQPMTPYVAEDGCQAFRADVSLDDSCQGLNFSWGVMIDSPAGPNVWGIPMEVNDPTSVARHRSFVLRPDLSEQRYYLTNCRRLGANKYFADDPAPGTRFAVWAPNAVAVDVVFGSPTSGYIYDDGEGIDSELGAFPMTRDEDGVWFIDPSVSPALAEFASYDHVPYMFRIRKDSGRESFRTDLYSRCQIGRGRTNPSTEGGFSGHWQDLDGTISCSVVIDPDRVTERFTDSVWPESGWLSDDEFWHNEFDPVRPLPTRVEDLVIYELHVGGLGAGRVGPDGEPEPGNFSDAIAHLDHLVDLGINAVELLPMSEFEGWSSWGYGTSHYLAVEFSGGGRDQFKHFVRECHRRGIAVILDVVYNHYHHASERAEWAYDSDEPERNIWYWYEGRPSDYPHATPLGHGGYVDNTSTGYAPRFSEEMVRQLFISSAAALALEFHVDGFRVDQTTSLHSYAVLHANGARAEEANIFGAKFLREWTRTLKLLKPGIMLMAEDHSGWDAVTLSPDSGGLGFDAVWYADFYHHLIGDGDRGPEYARLLHVAGFGDDRPLAMSYFAGALAASARRKVVYHESHDEAGNSPFSARTLIVAVNGAPLAGETRRYAEARARVVAGLTILSAGTPMFFMGEEVGATADYRYDDFVYHREDFEQERRGDGARLFRFYQDLIALRIRDPAGCSRNLRVVHVHDVNRVIAFVRDDPEESLLVVASLNNAAFDSGYWLQGVDDGQWREILNSDAAIYGGNNVGNAGEVVFSGGSTQMVLPANGLLVFRKSGGGPPGASSQ